MLTSSARSKVLMKILIIIIMVFENQKHGVPEKNVHSIQGYIVGR